MSIKPMLFNTEMVQAIENGRKTITRRVVKMPATATAETVDRVCIHNGVAHFSWSWAQEFVGFDVRMPYHPGDILYVRETWFYENHMEDLTAGVPDLPSGRYSHRYVYKANNLNYPVCPGHWRPAIHMPKEAARLFLRVTGVLAERLRDIDGRGVLAEGVDNGKSNPSMKGRWENMQRMAFSELWDSTVKPADLPLYGWAANPWVWVIEFERCRRPEGFVV